MVQHGNNMGMSLGVWKRDMAPNSNKFDGENAVPNHLFGFLCLDKAIDCWRGKSAYICGLKQWFPAIPNEQNGKKQLLK